MIIKVSKKLLEKNIFHRVEGDKIFTRKSITKIPSINEDLVYLIGIIAGDGSLIICKRKRGGNHHRLQITSCSPEHLESLNKILEENFKIRGKISKDKRKERVYRLTTANTSIFWYFKILEAKYNETNKIPKICKNKNYFNHYLAGLIDTDGHVTPSKNRIQLKLKNQQIINEIFTRIKHANPNSPKINYTKEVPFYYIRFDNIFPLRLKPRKSF